MITTRRASRCARGMIPISKSALVNGLVADAYAILAALDGVELDAEQSGAVGLLALVAGQDVEPGDDDDGTWRIAERVAPDRVISTVDPETRHMHKSRSEYRDGYKAHVAVEPETGLVTAAALTPANAPDGPTGVELLARERPGLQVLADSAYGSGEVRATLRRARHQAAIKAIPLRRAVPGGFDRDDFIIDHAARTARCPAGHTVTITSRGTATFQRHCNGGCPLRDQCTTAKTGRTAQYPRTRRRTRRSPACLAATTTSATTTANGDPWSSDPSPGSSPTVIAASATAASSGTSLGSPPASAAINLRRLVNWPRREVMPPRRRASGARKLLARSERSAAQVPCAAASDE